MAKDPAFLFYPSDFLTGVALMTYSQRGKYITLLCLQHQKGHLPEKDMIKICGTHDIDIFDKFIQDEDGLFYNQRLENETEKRKSYSDSRRINRLSKNKDMLTYDTTYDTTYVPHMENEDVNRDINTLNIPKESKSIYTVELPLIYKTIESELHIQLTPSMISFVNDYYDIGITKPVFQYAASETAKAGAQFRYFETIIKDLLDKGIKTDDDLTRYKAEYAKKPKQQSRAAPAKNNAESLKYIQRDYTEEDLSHIYANFRGPVPSVDLTEELEDE
jgi:hypothetical protein